MRTGSILHMIVACNPRQFLHFFVDMHLDGLWYPRKHRQHMSVDSINFHFIFKEVAIQLDDGWEVTIRQKMHFLVSSKLFSFFIKETFCSFFGGKSATGMNELVECWCFLINQDSKRCLAVGFAGCSVFCSDSIVVFEPEYIFDENTCKGENPKKREKWSEQSVKQWK